MRLVDRGKSGGDSLLQPGRSRVGLHQRLLNPESVTRKNLLHSLLLCFQGRNDAHSSPKDPREIIYFQNFEIYLQWFKNQVKMNVELNGGRLRVLMFL